MRCNGGGNCVYVNAHSWFGCCTGTAITDCDIYTGCVDRKSIDECAANSACYDNALVTVWCALALPHHLV